MEISDRAQCDSLQNKSSTIYLDYNQIESGPVRQSTMESLTSNQIKLNVEKHFVDHLIQNIFPYFLRCKYVFAILI